MTKLIELIKKNKALNFIDAETEENWFINQYEPVLWLNNQPKQLAFLYVDNSLVSVKALFQFLDSPHVVVLLNPKLHISFKIELEAKYRPNFIFDSERIQINDFEVHTFIEGQSIFSRVKKYEQDIDVDLKVLLTTSGTTGSPKFVKLSEKNLITNALSISEYLPIEAKDCTPLNLAIYYSYGLSILTSNSIHGGTIVCTNKDIINKEFWVDFEKFGYSSLAGVPYVYEMLNRIGFLKKNYQSLRYMTQAGGKLNNKLIELFHHYLSQTKKLFFVMYGQTEATARMSYLPPEMLPFKVGSIGIPIPGGNFEIDACTSELIYYGPNIYGGYCESINDLASYESVEALYTGDIAKKDEDGFYYILGRLKRFVKIFGSRTNLDDIESILKNHFIGHSFFAIGTEDEKLVVFILNSTILDIDIKIFLKEKMQIHPTVITIKILSEVPFTSNGKVNYAKLISHV